MNSASEETASIDLAVAFFSAIVVLFVFVKFNQTKTPEEELIASVGQRDQWQEAISSSWQAVPERGGFATYVAGKLVVLNMAEISRGIVDPNTGEFDNGWLDWSADSNPEGPPNAFSLDIWTALSAPPAAWQRATFDLSAEMPACSTGLTSRLLVFLPQSDENIGPLAEFGDQCNLQWRFHFLDETKPVDTISAPLQIGLNPSAYGREGMFR